MESVQAIKQRFGIIGNDGGLNRAIEKAIQVAPTDISVLVTGESGVGKEAGPGRFLAFCFPLMGNPCFLPFNTEQACITNLLTIQLGWV